MKKLVWAAVTAAGVVAAPASALTTFNATFENVAGGPTADGQFTIVSTAEGFSSTNGIELQRRAAGNPAANGGDVFVELDTNANSSIFRTIDAGTYNLNFLYSPRPGVPASSNGIEVLLNGVLLTPPGLLTGDGGADTSFAAYATSFTATANSTLTFRAVGTSDGVGGYLDNISLAPVPEPATWAMMIVGFGAIGASMRIRRRAVRYA